MRQNNFKQGKFPSREPDELNRRMYENMLSATVGRKVAEAQEEKGHPLSEEEIGAIKEKEWEKLAQRLRRLNQDNGELNIRMYEDLLSVKVGRRVAEAQEEKGQSLSEEEIEAIKEKELEKLAQRLRQMKQDKFELSKIPSNQLDEINTRIYRDMLLAKVRRRVAEAQEEKGHALNEEEVAAITREEWEKMTQWRKLLPKSSYKSMMSSDKRSSTIFNWRPPPGF